MARSKAVNPIIAQQIITPDQEEDVALRVREEVDSLAVMMKQLSELRQVVSLEARKTDLEQIQKIGKITGTLLDIVVDNYENIREAMSEALKKGNLRALKDISEAIQRMAEVREMLLGFDETRQAQSKRKMRLQVVWKGTDGSSGGLNIEA